jgi:hypothetical protein
LPYAQRERLEIGGTHLRCQAVAALPTSTDPEARGTGA